MQDSRASKQRLNEVHDMGEDWASNSTRPHAMITDLEESKLNLAHYIMLMATSTDSQDFPRSYMEAKKCLDFWQAPMEENMEIMRKWGVFKLVP